MALLLISHDLGVIAQNVDRMLVMYGGAVVESGPTERVFADMRHPYTRGLFAARPQLGGARGARLTTIAGTVPELVDLPAGCPFAGRCAFTIDACKTHMPEPTPLEDGHSVRCLRLEAVTEAARLKEPT
jgi:peptide/nickel transport system ATP-binding protein